MELREICNLIKFVTVRILIFPAILIITFCFTSYLSSEEVVSDRVGEWIFVLMAISIFSLSIFLLVKEAKKLHKNGQIFKQNINRVIIVFYILISVCAYDYIPQGDFMYAEISPCGKYKIEVYAHRPIIAFPGSGGLYDRTATVVLKNKWGRIIGQSNANSYGDLEIEWDYKEKWVWVSRGNVIDF